MITRIFALIFVIIFLPSSSTANKFTFSRQPIKEVDILGNRAFSDGELKNLLLTKQNRWHNIIVKRKISKTNLIIDSRQIERFYGRSGYLFTDVEYSADYYIDDSSKAVVTFVIDEGKQVNIAGLEISGGLPELNKSLSKFTKKIKLNEPVNNDAVMATHIAIRDFYADNGYPLVKVLSNYEFSDDSSQALVWIDIAESSFVYNGEITISREGEEKTRESVLLREMLVKKDRPFNRRLNVESQQRLYSTGLLKFVALKRNGPLYKDEAGRSVTDFRLVLSERKANFINFRAGVGRHPDFNAVFNTSVSWGNRNLWGTGRKLILNLGNSLRLSKEGTEDEPDTTVSSFGDLFSIQDLKFEPVRWAVGLNYVEPWFLGYRMPLSISVLYEPQTKNSIINKFFDRLSGETSLAKELNKFTNVRLSARVEFIDIHDVADSVQAYFRKQGDNSIRRRLSLSGQRDTRDNILIPQRGSYSYVSIDYVGHYLGGDFSYIKNEFYWSRYKASFGDNIIATRFRIGFLKELGAREPDQDRSSTDDRFTLGGANTVRGFSENYLGPKWIASDNVAPEQVGLPKGGKLLLLSNLELRRPLFWRFGGAAFVDVGNVFYDFDDFKLNKIETTAGLGLHFFTPVGPIRFDWAFRAKRELDLADGGWHLTILYAF